MHFFPTRQPAGARARIRASEALEEAIIGLFVATSWASELRSEREHRLRALEVPVAPDLATVLDFLDRVVPLLDPQGTSALAAGPQALLLRVWEFAKSQGLEPIYPRAGEAFVHADCEVAEVSREAPVEVDTVARVDTAGFRRNGQPFRKARVVVRR